MSVIWERKDWKNFQEQKKCNSSHSKNVCGCYHSTYFETWLNKRPQMIQLALGINKNRYKKTMWHSLYVPWLAERGEGGYDMILTFHSDGFKYMYMYQIWTGGTKGRAQLFTTGVGGGCLLNWPIINCGGWHFARSVTRGNSYREKGLHSGPL